MENNSIIEKKEKAKLLKKGKSSKNNSILTKRSSATKILFGVVFVIFVLYALSLILPFGFLLLNSLKAPSEYVNDLINGGIFSLPENPLFGNYIDVFKEMKISDSFGNDINFLSMTFNSVWFTAVTIFGGLAASTLVAYCLAKYNFMLRNVLYGIAIVSMTIPIVGSTGAMFKLSYDLRIYNTPLYPILTSFGGFGFNFLIMYGFFKNISWSYAEAVFIDGGGHFTAFLKIMLPQVLPAMVTLGIMAFIGAWNDYTTPLLYLPDFPTIASGVYEIQTHLKRGGNYPQYFAALVISIIPVMIIFVSFSDTIMQNFTVGGLKG